MGAGETNDKELEIASLRLAFSNLNGILGDVLPDILARLDSIRREAQRDGVTSQGTREPLQCPHTGRGRHWALLIFKLLPNSSSRILH